MKVFKSIFTGLNIVIMVACFGALLLLNWSGFGWKALAIPTGSMRPDIPPGSMVLVHRVPDSSLKVGDVITYINPLDPKRTISHRIVRTYLLDGKVRTFVTKGDANPSTDVPVTSGSVQGKVAWHVPYVGNVLLYAKEPIVILPIIYIAALLIMIEEVQRLSEYYKRWITYRLPGYKSEPERERVVAKRMSLGATLTAVFVLAGAVAGPSALAALRSNTVVLAHNKLSVAASSGGGGGTCSGNNTNNVNVHTSTNQKAKTGNAKTSGTGNTGNATSGNASNSNSTSINININC